MTRTPFRGTPLRTLLISLLAVFGLVLTACSSDDGGSGGDGDSSGDTITIEHAFGSTEIEGTPERVATVQFENQEVPLALGVVPVGMAKANFGGSDVLPWVQEQLDELGVSGDDEPVLFDESDGIDFEAVSDTAPDVILAGYSGLEQEDYDKLSEIAPTIPFPQDQVAWGTPWRENIEIESKAIGKEDEGKDLIADLESQITEVADANPEIKGKKTMFLTHVEIGDLSKVSFYTSHDTRPMFFEDLGMEAPDSIKKFSEENDSFSGTISTEQADVFDDVDIIVTYGDQELLDAMKDNPVLGQIPAIKNDAVVLLENDELGTAAMPTPLGIPYILDDYVKVLSDAAAKSES
ncbi:ABC-type iron transporter, substrate-binding lipoprotein [Corynebacterium glyciniphilum AJ 3170]|uniref:ABC-type iron transporter, substrate-binding lipoprotein n=1 Tax=Corynebacterium glyciniphilum AJ 3170 TaxID=1404245 RepID=X5E8C9_9CORY|nr:iron-siderophore ABC transporter substrate-binding protein [Corynebacterium glyciniphilum]AHW62926.1 ABC-type iron transporter, substrate-binding lipoprotein [Corynebacterium glyciniphilum AJ 3170]